MLLQNKISEFLVTTAIPIVLKYSLVFTPLEEAGSWQMCKAYFRTNLQSARTTTERNLRFFITQLCAVSLVLFSFSSIPLAQPISDEGVVRLKRQYQYVKNNSFTKWNYTIEVIVQLCFELISLFMMFSIFNRLNILSSTWIFKYRASKSFLAGRLQNQAGQKRCFCF